MPADVNFTTLVAAFMATLEYGMEGAQAVCKGRVSHLRGELEAVQKSVEVNLRRHFSILNQYSVKVHELLLKAMNGDLNDAMTALTTQGGVLCRKHPYAASPPVRGCPCSRRPSRGCGSWWGKAPQPVSWNAWMFRGSPPTRQQARSGEMEGGLRLE